MALLTRLSELFHGIVDPDRDAPESEAHLTVAALLVLVARIDGRLLPTEDDGLKAMVGDRFGLSKEATARLIERAAALDADLDPASAMAERIVHDFAPAQRSELLAMAYRIAAADGQVHEFEDDLLWRVGRLLGLPEDAIAGIRDGALRGPGTGER
jgi:uncharacterized tellurite resistance protein B-like protein